MTDLYYDLNGKAIKGKNALMEWAELCKSPKRILKQDFFCPRIKVSTVWLGLDHNFGGGKPLIFETIIFFNHKTMEMFRYSTREEAESGHQEAVKMVKNPIKRILYIIKHHG